MTRRSFAILAVYVLTVLAVAAAFAAKLVPTSLTVPVALIPIAPASLLPFVLLQKIRAMDELQQRIQFEGMAFGFATAALVSLSIGYLQMFAHVSEINWIWVWPLLGVCQAVGIVTSRRRYR